MRLRIFCCIKSSVFDVNFHMKLSRINRTHMNEEYIQAKCRSRRSHPFQYSHLHDLIPHNIAIVWLSLLIQYRFYNYSSRALDFWVHRANAIVQRCLVH